MQFRDLKRQYEVLKPQIDAEIKEVIETTSFINGKKVDELEVKLAQYIGVKHCITCANGTDALSMALMALNIKEGDCVFVPVFTFFASAEVVSFAGATPIFVDVDSRNYNMDPRKLEEAIERVVAEGKLIPKAIISVDLFGLPADYDLIRPISDKYGLKIVEDGAQGFGGAINGKKACSFGDISTTSFFPAKPLGCYGDGGAIFTNDDDVAEYLKSVRNHGKGSFKYDNIRIGWNSRLDTMQAGILLAKFQAFVDNELDAVNKLAARYTEALENIVLTPKYEEKFYSSWAQYTIRLKDESQRNSLQQYLNEQGIPTMIYYPKPLNQQGAFEYLNTENDFPAAEILCKTVLSLPMHPYLTDEELTSIIQHIEIWHKNR